MWTANLFLYRDMSIYCDCLIKWQKQLCDNSQLTILSDLACEIFNLKLWFENNPHCLRMDFLSIGFCIQTNKQRWQCFSLSNMQRNKGSKRIEMIKMVKRNQTHDRPFWTPKPDACTCTCIHHWTKGCQAAGPLGRCGLGAPGHWAVGLLLTKPGVKVPFC